jgi:hypothetical protein
MLSFLTLLPTVRKLALVGGLVGTDFGLNISNNYIKIFLAEPLNPSYSANWLFAVDFIYNIATATNIELISLLRHLFSDHNFSS